MTPRETIIAKTHKGLVTVPVSEVIAFRADCKYVTCIHESGEVLLDEALTRLEAEYGDRFLRIHRNALVARDRLILVVRASSTSRAYAYLRGVEKPLNVSRRFFSAALQAFANIAEESLGA